MSARRILVPVIALLLGVGSALLVGCDNGTRGGLPAANADQLSRALDAVRTSVQAGECQDVDGELRRVDTGIDRLPADVDDRLVARLRDASDRLHGLAYGECNTNRLNRQQPTTTETQPETQTETLNTTTTVEPPTETETQPTDTTTIPPTDTGETTTPTVPDTSQSPGLGGGKSDGGGDGGQGGQG